MNTKSFLFPVGALMISLMCLTGCSKDESGSNVPSANTFNEWPSYSPTLDFDFRTEYSFEMPENDMTKGVTGVGWRMDDRWWTFVAGKKANHLVTEEAVRPLLERLNTDFDYLRDVMGWAPDRNVQNGYRSAVYLYGSGLSTDNADSTETGGWQSALYLSDGSWPMILISYYPVYCFNPECDYSDIEYHTDGVVHEGIHCIFSSLPGGKKAGWINEGANTWLQRTMELQRAGVTDYSNVDLGWLSMGSILAPFMPIECYSGWLTDGTFGGPNGEGVNGNTRNLVGGVQYSSMFPTFLEEVLGEGSIKWIWQNCTGRVLEGMATELGEEQMKRLIMEYRARLALADLGKYSQPIITLYNSYMGKSIRPEYSQKVDSWAASPYVKAELDEDGLLVPEERTLPGWTGANILPIITTGESLTVEFTPIGENMSCQLCYRTKDGKTVYGEPFYEGECRLDLKNDVPANGVVFAVVCNLNYRYVGQIRTKHYDYRLKLVDGASELGATNKKWYNWKLDL